MGTFVEPDAPGGRPEDVVLATKCLLVNVGLGLLDSVLVYAYSPGLRLGAFLFWLLTAVVLRLGFVALIWYGISWARTLFLIFVAIVGAVLIWRLTAAAPTNTIVMTVTPLVTTISGVKTVIDLFAGWLLLQPESAEWFHR